MASVSHPSRRVVRFGWPSAPDPRRFCQLIPTIRQGRDDCVIPPPVTGAVFTLQRRSEMP